MVERGVVMVDRGEEGCGEGREGVLMVYRGVVVVVVVVSGMSVFAWVGIWNLPH